MKNIPIRNINAKSEKTNLPESFSIRDVRNLLAGKDMVQQLHRHDYFYILALKKGTGRHEIDFTSHRIRDHSVFFMRPGQVHQLRLKAASAGFLMQFKADFYYSVDKASAKLLRRASQKNVCPLDAKKFRRLLSILGYIYQEYTNQQDGYQEIIKANLGIFFIELLRHRQDHKSPSDNVNTYLAERLEAFLELLELPGFKQNKVSKYADMLNLSTYQLNAITRKGLGKTSSELINEHVILESKRYLLATSNQVNQIAYHLGYEDVSYFIRFFKKHTGYSPEAFRNNFK